MIAETVLKPAAAGTIYARTGSSVTDPQSGGAGRRNHGVADRRPPGQRRPAGGAAGHGVARRGAKRDRRAGARGPEEEQARGIFRPLARGADHHRQFRGRSGAAGGLRLGDRGGHREPGDQAGAARKGRAAPEAGRDPHHQHQRPADRVDRRESCRSSLRRRWFGTHFFNPPRYMRLVEIIPTPETDPAAPSPPSPTSADLRLGKEVVFARDTPNFIANRIGVFIMLEAVRLMQERRPHHRRGGCAHRHGDRLAAHRDVPPGRPGGAGRAGARGLEFRPAARIGRRSR